MHNTTNGIILKIIALEPEPKYTGITSEYTNIVVSRNI
jgi:hypothetical protein